MKFLKAFCGLTVVALVLSGCGGGSNSSSSAVSSASSSGAGVSSAPPGSGTSGSGSSGSGSSGSGSGSNPPPTGSATLKWTAPTTNTNGSALTGLAGYHIYYGTSAGSMTNEIDVANAGTTSYVISNLSAGTWYFGIIAYTNSGLESAMSNVGSKTIT
jgi:hypothetical protein